MGGNAVKDIHTQAARLGPAQQDQESVPLRLLHQVAAQVPCCAFPSFLNMTLRA